MKVNHLKSNLIPSYATEKVVQSSNEFSVRTVHYSEEKRFFCLILLFCFAGILLFSGQKG